MPPSRHRADLVLTRSVVHVGGTNTATISGCKPGGQVPFVLRSWDQPGTGNSLGDGTIPLGTATVGADGSASITFTLPRWVTPDSYAVKAMCDLPHGYHGWLATEMKVVGGYRHTHRPARHRAVAAGAAAVAAVLATRKRRLSVGL